MPSEPVILTAADLLSLADLLPEACALLENDDRPAAQAWIRKAQRAAADIIGRREKTEESEA